MVTRTDEGEYVATPTPRYVDDVPRELEPEPVPTFIDEEPEEPGESGVRTVDR